MTANEACYKHALYRIFQQLGGISKEDLTKAETNILSILRETLEIVIVDDRSKP